MVLEQKAGLLRYPTQFPKPKILASSVILCCKSWLPLEKRNNFKNYVGLRNYAKFECLGRSEAVNMIFKKIRNTKS